MNVLVLKVLLASFLTLIIVVAYFMRQRYPVVQVILNRRGVLLLLIALLRLLPFTLIFLVVNIGAQSDVTAYFWPQATSALSGEVIYRDFVSHYAPFFPYLLAAAVSIWYDPRAIILLMILIESSILLTTHQIYTSQRAANHRGFAAFIYLCLPLPWMMIVLGGQEDIWLWGAGILIYSLIRARHTAWAGVTTSLAFLSTKALFAIAALPLFAIVPNRRPWINGFVLTTLAFSVPLWMIVETAITMPLREGSSVSPPNLWFTMNTLLGDVFPLGSSHFSIASLAFIMILGTWVAWTYRRSILTDVTCFFSTWVLIFVLVLLLSPKSLTNYIAIFMMPLAYLLQNHQVGVWQTSAVLLLNLIGSIQSSFWYRLGGPSPAQLATLDAPSYAIEIAMEAVMLLILVWLAYQCVCWIRLSSKC
jgi:hypothetical protein